MRAMGLDIGTTTLSAVVIDTKNGQVLKSLTEPNDTHIEAQPWARLQDPQAILIKAQAMLGGLISDYPHITCIGLTGQMHGILYADSNGDAVSPLFTWQDGRGELIMSSGQTYAQALSTQTQRNLATGYGAVTHFYNMCNGLVPDGARFIMAIHDYVGMKLTGRMAPLTHDSDAASFGAPDDPEFARFLRVTGKTELLGKTHQGIPVAVAIGDNQASFIGSVRRPADSVLVNVGTGGQVSVALNGAVQCEGCETRPYVDGGSLLVGFSLCGGRAYALLERFFREIAVLAGAPDEKLYGVMNALAAHDLPDPLRICTLFSGTRSDPGLRGSIESLGADNFTPQHFVQGVLTGMADELHQPYLEMLAHTKSKPTTLVGSGNGIRQNPALRRMFERAFGMDMVMPAHNEEAAYGACLFALAATSKYPSVRDAQEIISYTR